MQAAQAGILDRNAETKGFRPDIEGLRAVAVIGVVAFHFGVPRIPGGFVGVDIFFVISGYLITRLLIQEVQENGRIDLLRFYGRRARRLLPALLLMTLVTLVAIAVVLGPSDQRRYAASAAATSLYASNILFMRQALDYFGPLATANPFLHTWSLGVEEQFYLAWPALIWLVGRRKVRSALPGATLIGVTLVSFVLCLWLTGIDQPWAFYSSPARVWEFGFGGLAAPAWVTGLIRRRNIAAPLGWIAACALLLSFVFIKEASNIPGFMMLLPVAATACILISGAVQSEQGPARILGMTPFQWFGRRSYSIYLWHWPIIALALALYPSLSIVGRVSCAALTLICASASYRWLENPVRNSPWLGVRAIRSVALAACLTAMGAVASLGTLALAKHFSAAPRQSALISVVKQRSIAERRVCVSKSRSSTPQPCVIGITTAPITVVLFGDSHAAQWSTPLSEIAPAVGWRVLMYLKSGCPVADVPVYDRGLHRVSHECATWRAKSIEEIVRLHPNIVVASEFSSQYFDGPRSDSYAHSLSMATWAAGLERSLSALRAAGSSIVFLRDTPTPQWDMRSCLSGALWRHVSQQTCDLPRSLAVDVALTRSESQVVSAIPDVHLLDLTSQFCSETTCPAWRNGMVVYRDNSHITDAYAVSLTEPLRTALVATLGRWRPGGPQVWIKNANTL